MATYSLANERLRALEDIEREIGAILQNAGFGKRGADGRGRRPAPDSARNWGGTLNAGLRAELSLQPESNTALYPPWQEQQSWNCPRKKRTSVS